MFANARLWPTTTILLVACATSSTKTPMMSSKPAKHEPVAPRAKRVDHALVAHGHRRNDPYYWLRDDQRKDPAMLEYLAQENAYTEAVMGHTKALQKTLFDEVVARIAKQDASVPVLLDGYWRYERYEEDKEHAIHCRKKGSLEASEEVVLDVNIEAARHKYYSVAALAIPRDGAIVAFAEDMLGRRIFTIRFKDLRSGKMLDDRIERAAGAIVWAADNRTLFYSVREKGTLRSYRVYRHVLGTDPKDDPLVYEEKDNTFRVGVWLTKSRQYVVIGSESTLVSERRLVATNKPAETPMVFLPREAKHEYDIDHAGAGDRFFVRTNWQARNFRLMSVPLERSSDKGAWREEIPARETVFLHDFDLFADYLVVNERRAGLRGLRVIPWNARDKAHEIDFGEPIYTAHLGANPTVDTKVLRFVVNSLTTPRSVYDYDMSDRRRTLKKRDKVLGNFDPQHYVAERLEATARDGTKVPLSLVYRRDLDRSKPQPLYLYGYGSYGYSMDPRFSSSRLSLLDRGFIYAIAHVRGGQEMGRAWYEDGRLLNKKNTFTDFIDCARYLIDKRYTSAGQLAAGGGSAGGLLIGAVANMAPELFAALVAYVPFVDVLTTMLDESIPLTTFEYDEWGNPNDRRFYDYILSYSPYDQVRRGPYPHMIVFSGLHDSQVQYWEPTKWVARLRARKTDDNRLLLRTNMEAGHSGASGRFRKHRDFARELAFLLDVLGLPLR